LFNYSIKISKPYDYPIQFDGFFYCVNLKKNFFFIMDRMDVTSLIQIL